MHLSVVAAATSPRLLPERHPAAPPRLIRLPASIRANRFRRNEAQNPEDPAAGCAHQSAHPILCQGRFCAEAPNNGITCRSLRSAGSGQGTLLRPRVSGYQQVTIGYGPVAPTWRKRLAGGSRKPHPYPWALCRSEREAMEPGKHKAASWRRAVVARQPIGQARHWVRREIRASFEWVGEKDWFARHDFPRADCRRLAFTDRRWLLGPQSNSLQE